MWFGDLVTMRWWDDLWLNESFAEFMAYHAAATATRFTDAWTGFATSRKAWGYRQDQLPSTHPIAADAPDLETAKTNFDGITYAKGASVLKQLVAWVGIEHFMAGVRTYFDKHAWGNTVLADLLVELEATSGRDSPSGRRSGCRRPGATRCGRRSASTTRDGTCRSRSSRRPPPTTRPCAPTASPSGSTTAPPRASCAGAGSRPTWSGPSRRFPELVGETQPDLLLLNDDDLTFAKVRLDERSLVTLTTSLGDLTESLPRALCWSAAWDMTRDGEMRARDFTQLVANGVGTESDIVTVQSVLRQAASALDLYVAPDGRAGGQGGVRGRPAHVARAGRGRQRPPAGVRAYVRRGGRRRGRPGSGRRPSRRHPGAARADHRHRPAVVPAPALVTTGVRGDAAIDAELERDSTASGQRQAAGVRAARPTAAAKEEAWSSVVDSDALPNALMTATIAGFQDPRPPRAAAAVRRPVLHIDRPRMGRAEPARWPPPSRWGCSPRCWSSRTWPTAPTHTCARSSHPDRWPGCSPRAVTGLERALRCQARDAAA